MTLFEIESSIAFKRILKVSLWQLTTTNIYDSAGHLTCTTDALGNSTTNYYDVSGNLTETIDALGNQTAYTYDSDGNQLTVTDALKNVTQNTYDGLGHLVVASRFIGGVPVERCQA